jgi:alpha-L-fucosidase
MKQFTEQDPGKFLVKVLPLSAAALLSAQGFNEGKNKPLGAEDFCFTAKGNTVYAIFFGWPDNRKVLVKSLVAEKISAVHLLGYNDKLDGNKLLKGLL